LNDHLFLKQRLKQQGFLMVDVMSALIIIAVVLMSVSGMFILAVKTNTSANHYTAAANLAAQQMEKLKPLFQFPTTTYQIADYPVTDSIALSGLKYEIVTEAKLIDVDKKIVQVTVTVLWVENGHSRSLKFVTYCLRTISIYPVT
jgi:Tfp pilus assembly protein PilE